MNMFSAPPRSNLPLQPAFFRAVKDLSFVRFSVNGPSFAQKKRRVTGARANGIKYEKKVHEEMLRQYPKHYLPSPWFNYFDVYGQRWAQPDALLIDPVQGQIIVIEVKHHHIGEAWWKLHYIYLPVVRMFFGDNWTYRCVEIVRYYDSDTLFPQARLCEFIHLAPQLPYTGVHIWNPAR